MKGSIVVEAMQPDRAHVLRGHLRTDVGTCPRAVRRPERLAAYLGNKDKFDAAITDFSERYADQNDQDYRAFTEAIRSGRLHAVEGL